MCIRDRAAGVLTQYQPLVLNEYIGNGQPWDLDGMNSGVQVLSPYQRSRGADWYKGTANAIYQNMNYIERYNPDYVVILSGDHIYKMDYSKMVAYHKAVSYTHLPIAKKGIINIKRKRTAIKIAWRFIMGQAPF